MIVFKHVKWHDIVEQSGNILWNVLGPVWLKLITTPPQFDMMQDDNFVWKIIGGRQKGKQFPLQQPSE